MWDYLTAYAKYAQRRRTTGVVLLGIAGVVWTVLAYRLFLSPEEIELYEDDRTTFAASDFKWLACSVPVGIAGAVLYTIGTIQLSVREYVAEHHEQSKMKQS